MARLINTSMSSRGWSFYSDDAYCPALPFAKGRQAIKPPTYRQPPQETSAPLIKGTMGHVLQSHYLARIGATQPGGVVVAGEVSTDPDEWLTPEEALLEWVGQNPEGEPYVDAMLQCFDGYLLRHPDPMGVPVTVESELFGVLGKKDGKWGYWAVSPIMADWLRRPVAEHPSVGLLAVDGGAVFASPLRVEGHPENGYPVWMSRRSDADIMLPDGRIAIVDHKHKGKVVKREINPDYALEGGFCAFRHLGSQTYGDRFGGVWIQAIQVPRPHRVERVRLHATPERDRTFATRLWLRAHEKARREVLDPSGESFKGWREHSGACWTRWGRACEGVEWCFGVRADEL